MVSIVIAAHNEAAVIARCLDALADGAEEGEMDVVVVANGCHDDTANVARAHRARVVELARAGKTAALNAGDAVVRSFPRVYLDADMTLNAYDIRHLVAPLMPGHGGDDGAPPLATAPARHVDSRGRPIAVRAYYAISSRLPVYEHALFGRGAVALSEAGRSRFREFPDVVADDLFLDGLFTPAEKDVVQSVRSVVASPRRTNDLVARLARVRAGNRNLRHSADHGARPVDRWSWLRDVVLPRPWLLPAGVIYATIVIRAEWRARTMRGTGHATQWGQDASTRSGPPRA